MRYVRAADITAGQTIHLHVQSGMLAPLPDYLASSPRSAALVLEPARPIVILTGGFVEIRTDQGYLQVPAGTGLRVSDEATVQLRIDNTYEDGTEITTTVRATVPAPTSYEPDALHDWAWDHLWDLTGTGRPEGDALYSVLVEESDVPGLRGRRFEF